MSTTNVYDRSYDTDYITMLWEHKKLIRELLEKVSKLETELILLKDYLVESNMTVTTIKLLRTYHPPPLFL